MKLLVIQVLLIALTNNRLADVNVGSRASLPIDPTAANGNGTLSGPMPMATSADPTGEFTIDIDYNPDTGVLKVSARGAVGTVEYQILGLGSWTTGNTFTVPTWQRSGVEFTIQARTPTQGEIKTKFTTGQPKQPASATQRTQAPPPTQDLVVTRSQTRQPEGSANSLLAGTNATGVQFTTTTAPRLPHAPLTAVGNQAAIDYNFTDQAAQWQMDLGRFPPFDMGGKKIFGIGYPVYKQASKNLHASRGNIMLNRDAKNIPGQDPKDSFFFWADACYNHCAYVSLNTGLPVAVRREAAIFAGREAFASINRPVPAEFAAEVRAKYHPYPTLAEVGIQAGKSGYSEWSQQESVGNKVPEHNFLDLETNDVWPGRNFTSDHDLFMIGFQAGMKLAWAADANHKPYSPKFWGYGIDMADVGFSHQSQRDPATGLPAYYLNQHSIYNNPALLKTFEQGGVGVDSYWRTSVGEDTDYFVYNPDGTVKIENGKPVYNPTNSSYTAYGVTVNVDHRQYQHNLHELYGTTGKIMAVLYHLNGNVKPERRSSRKPDARSVSAFSWDRHTTEGMAGYIAGVPDFPQNQNYYPIASWIAEGMTVIKWMLIDAHIRWSMNKPVHNPGENYTPNADGADRGTDGVYESFAKADHRVSLVPELFNSDGKWVFFTHPYVNNMEGDGDRVTDKLLQTGLLYTEAGKPCFGITAMFPGQRKTDTRTVEVWFTKNGKTSPIQTFQLVGRHATIFRFPLPSGFQDLSDADCWIRYTDLTGTVRTRNGAPK